MTSRPHIPLLLLCACFLGAATQTRAFVEQLPQGNHAVVSGIVRQAGDGSPVEGVSLRLAQGATVYTVVSDATGRFATQRIPWGRYYVTASKAGFLPGEYGQRFPGELGRAVDVRSAEGISGIVVPIWAKSNISGSVMDAAGRPREKTPVRAFQIKMYAGQQDLRLQSTVMSGSDGDFLLEVPPGQYVISAGSGGINEGGPAEGGSALRGVVFLPGVYQPSQATVLDLFDGYRFDGLTIKYDTSKSRSVSGVLTAPTETDTVQFVELLWAEPGLGYGLQAQRAPVRNGLFAFSDVTPGRYSLRAVAIPRAKGTPSIEFEGYSMRFVGWRPSGQAPIGLPTIQPPPEISGVFGQVDIEVSDKDIENVALALQVLPGLTGRIKFSGNRQPPNSTELNRSMVILSGLGGPRLRIPPVRVEADGAFRFPSVPPGEYVLSWLLTSGGWFTESLTYAGETITGRPFRSDNVDAELVLTLTDSQTALSGYVRDSRGNRVKDASVYLFSQDRRLWTGLSPMLTAGVKETRAGSDGEFEFPVVLPGDYFLVASDGRPVEAYAERANLAKLAASASRISLTKGQRTSNVAVTATARIR